MTPNRMKIFKKIDWTAIKCGLILLTALVSLLLLAEAVNINVLPNDFSLDRNREHGNSLHFGIDNCSPSIDNCSPSLNVGRISKGDAIALARGSARATNNIEILSN
jgi:hypothetical protein